MATQVKFTWNDKAGDYHVWATVDSNDTVRILEIETDDGDSCDILDWTSAEQFAMKNLARKAASELEDDDGEDEGDFEERDDSFYDR